MTEDAPSPAADQAQGIAKQLAGVAYPISKEICASSGNNLKGKVIVITGKIHPVMCYMIHYAEFVTDDKVLRLALARTMRSGLLVMGRTTLSPCYLRKLMTILSSTVPRWC